MKILSDPRRKYLLLIPLAFLIVNAAFFRYANQRVEEALLEEKLAAVSDAVDMLAAAAEADPLRPWADHEQNIREAVEFLDRLYQVYAGAYKVEGDRLELITGRFYETSIFEPLEHRAFLNAISTGDQGNVVVGYTPENQDYRELHLYFRWLPLYAPAGDRCLAVAGVSRYSVVTRIPALVSAGQWASMAVTFVLQVWIVVLLAHLGSVWERRRGDKWRCERDRQGGSG